MYSDEYDFKRELINSDRPSEEWGTQVFSPYVGVTRVVWQAHHHQHQQQTLKETVRKIGLELKLAIIGGNIIYLILYI